MKTSYGENHDFNDIQKVFENSLFHPSISYVINTAVSFAFKELLFFISGNYNNCNTLGRFIQFNTYNYTSDTFILKCNENCEVCSDLLKQNKIL